MTAMGLVIQYQNKQEDESMYEPMKLGAGDILDWVDQNPSYHNRFLKTLSNSYIEPCPMNPEMETMVVRTSNNLLYGYLIEYVETGIDQKYEIFRYLLITRLDKKDGKQTIFKTIKRWFQLKLVRISMKVISKACKSTSE